MKNSKENSNQKLFDFFRAKNLPDVLMLERWLFEYSISNQEFSEMLRKQKNEHYQNLRDIRELFVILKEWKKENFEQMKKQRLKK